MNQSQFLAVTWNSLEAREKSRVHGAIGFGFASHWLKNWRESSKPITKRCNRNHVITFDSHLKTALFESHECIWTAELMCVVFWLGWDLISSEMQGRLKKFLERQAIVRLEYS